MGLSLASPLIVALPTHGRNMSNLHLKLASKGKELGHVCPKYMALNMLAYRLVAGNFKSTHMQCIRNSDMCGCVCEHINIAIL